MEKMYRFFSHYKFLLFPLIRTLSTSFARILNLKRPNLTLFQYVNIRINLNFLPVSIKQIYRIYYLVNKTLEIVKPSWTFHPYYSNEYCISFIIPELLYVCYRYLGYDIVVVVKFLCFLKLCIMLSSQVTVIFPRVFVTFWCDIKEE